jgi:AAA+ superfamily predicted ATPase
MDFTESSQEWLRLQDLCRRLQLSEIESRLLTQLYAQRHQSNDEGCDDVAPDLLDAALQTLEEKGLVEGVRLSGAELRSSVRAFVDNRSAIDLRYRWFLSRCEESCAYETWKDSDRLVVLRILSQSAGVVRSVGGDFANAQAMFARLLTGQGRPLFVIDLKAMDSLRYNPELHQLCDEIAADIAIWNGVAIMDALDDSLASVMMRSLTSRQVNVVAHSETKCLNLGASFIVNLQDAALIKAGEYWKHESQQLGLALCDETVGRLESIFPLGQLATRRVLQECCYSPVDKRDFVAIAAICRKYSSHALEEYAKRITPRYSWDDIILPAVTKRKLHEVYDFVSSQSRVEEDWKFRKRHSRGHGVTVLLKGQSGTGKTMAAEVLARELGMDLYQVDLASVSSKYIGETQKNLSKIFAAARSSAGILFFDEGEMLFSKRSSGESSHDKYANLEVNFLLQEIEAYDGVVVISTNHSHMIDSAFLRRIMFDIEFPRPAESTRRTIWMKHLGGGIALHEDVNLDFLASLPLAGGTIHNIVKRAAAVASMQKGSERHVRMRDILHGIRREYQKADIAIDRDVFGVYWRYASSEWELASIGKLDVCVDAKIP